MLKVLVLAILVSMSNPLFAEEKLESDAIIDPIHSAYESGDLSDEGAELLLAAISKHCPEDYATYEEWEQDIFLFLGHRYIEGENKNAEVAKTIVRVVWNAVKSGPAQAATHDGKGRCNAGCGSNSGRSSP
jgi:hypothetical protein